MLPKGPFQPADFKPDIPEDALQRLHEPSESKNDDETMSHMDKEQQDKEEYRKRRLRDEKEIVWFIYFVSVLIQGIQEFLI